MVNNDLKLDTIIIMNSMKYPILFSIAFMAISCVACTGIGYRITGTVENAKDGDTVLLQEVVDGDLQIQERTVINNGRFSFEGRQDSVVNRYITCIIDGHEYLVDFFLENGNINMNLSKENVSVTGTSNNDIYQSVREAISNAMDDINQAYAILRDTTLTDEQRKEAEQQVRKKDAAYYQTVKECMKKNITNLSGISLFKQMYRQNTLEENDSLLQLVPAMYQDDQTIKKIKERVENGKRTLVGKQFVDFELLTPEGEKRKLSDFAGQGKFVLLDFWASWCAPCRKEMPNLVAAHEKYKNLEIIGISLDKDKEEWQKAIAQLKITWPQLSDLDGWKCKAAKLYAVQSIPYTVLIDGDGVIVGRALRGEELQNKLAEVMKD